MRTPWSSSPFIAARRTLESLKVTPSLGGRIALPVWGFLALRASFSFTENFPNPLTSTSSPFWRDCLRKYTAPAAGGKGRAVRDGAAASIQVSLGDLLDERQKIVEFWMYPESIDVSGKPLKHRGYHCRTGLSRRRRRFNLDGKNDRKDYRSRQWKNGQMGKWAELNDFVAGGTTGLTLFCR